MSPRRMTPYVVWGLIALALLYDAWALATGGYEATITHYVRETSSARPELAFVAGFVAGHLFWSRK